LPARSSRSTSASTHACTRADASFTRAAAAASSGRPAGTPPASITGAASARAARSMAAISSGKGSMWIPAAYGRPVSTSNRSTWRLASRIARGPWAAPPP
jgi:hypothetical protein